MHSTALRGARGRGVEGGPVALSGRSDPGATARKSGPGAPATTQPESSQKRQSAGASSLPSAGGGSHRSVGSSALQEASRGSLGVGQGRRSNQRRRGLGNTAQFVSADVPGGPTRTATRYRLQSVAASLLPGQRVAHCMRTPHGGSVEVLHQAGAECGSYAGLQTCGSVWLCPVCAAKISERRREELSAAIAAWEAKGGSVVMVTYTLSHESGDSLRSTLEGLTAALQSLRSTRQGRAWVERWGVVGAVRALEVTYGRHGWHPHVHQLCFVEAPVDPEQFRQELLALWQACVKLKAMRNVNCHGIDVAQGDMTVSEYVAKFGHERTWGADRELAKASSKASRSGRNPVQLLEAAGDGDEAAAARWLEYAAVMPGSHQLRWSPGLRALLGLGEAKSDEQLAEEQTESAELVCRLDPADWKRIVGQDARAELLEVAATRSPERILFFLTAFGCEDPEIPGLVGHQVLKEPPRVAAVAAVGPSIPTAPATRTPARFIRETAERSEGRKVA